MAVTKHCSSFTIRGERQRERERQWDTSDGRHPSILLAVAAGGDVARLGACPTYAVRQALSRKLSGRDSTDPLTYLYRTKVHLSLHPASPHPLTLLQSYGGFRQEPLRRCQVRRLVCDTFRYGWYADTTTTTNLSSSPKLTIIPTA